jgi:hypothetical protein
MAMELVSIQTPVTQYLQCVSLQSPRLLNGEDDNTDMGACLATPHENVKSQAEEKAEEEDAALRPLLRCQIWFGRVRAARQRLKEQ